MASTLGLVELAAQSQQLEQDLANNSQTLAERMAPIARLLSELPGLLGEEDPSPAANAAPLGSHWQQQLLRQIEELLVQSDTAVIPLFEQYAAPLLLALGTGSPAESV